MLSQPSSEHDLNFEGIEIGPDSPSPVTTAVTGAGQFRTGVKEWLKSASDTPDIRKARRRHHEIASLLNGLGFDPYVGFFHKLDYGRASLAADLEEEFRAPLADRLTLSLFNLNVFSKDSFKENPKNKAVYFTRSAMQRYFEEYEKMVGAEFKHPKTGEVTTLRKSIRRQAQHLAQTISANVPYEPFEMPV